MWRPWRIEWIEKGQNASDGCPFCLTPEAASKLPGLVAAASDLCYATLNLYPYNGGHIMVLPYRHVADLADLTADEAADVMAVLKDGVQALRQAMQPSGFNIGLNMGASAGAGVPQHLHFHIVPRWLGDTNFMPVVGNTKVLPESLESTKERIVAAWPQRGS